MAFKKNNKSQSAIEFIILIFFVLTYFCIFFLVVEERVSDKSKQNKNNYMEEVALNVQDEITLASKSSDGYRRDFKIPLDLNGQGYNINLTEGSVYIRTTDMKYSTALPILPTIGDVKTGENFIIKKEGKVYLNILI